MKKYILIAGVNGAGKSTLFQTIDSLKNMQRINTDEIVRSFGRWDYPKDVMKAGMIAVKKVNEYFEAGISFNQETTLCGKSIIKNIQKAKQMGYKIEIHYVGLESPDIAKERIASRVRCGGHGIPDADVERRYYESFQALKEVVKLSDIVVLYDNTKAFRRFAVYERGLLATISEQPPKWYENYVE